MAAFGVRLLLTFHLHNPSNEPTTKKPQLHFLGWGCRVSTRGSEKPRTLEGRHTPGRAWSGSGLQVLGSPQAFSWGCYSSQTENATHSTYHMGGGGWGSPR